MSRRPYSTRVWIVLALLLSGMGLAGEASAAASNPMAFFTVVPPCRVFDSRTPADGPALQGGSPRVIQIAGKCGVPSNARSVVLNITVTQATAGGSMIIGPGDATLPAPPNDAAMERITFQPGRTRANNGTVDLASDNSGTVKALAKTGVGKTVHLILDVSGYYADSGAVNDAATVLEDAAATAINVLANDLTPGATIASATDPAHGTVVLTGGSPGAHTGLTYQPDANYCNTQPGGTPDTFNYTINPGGSTATVSVTVTCVNDDPVANDDTATVAEDSGATAVNVLANDTDPENDTFTIASVTQPANGTVVITGGGTGLTYQPNANYCNNPPGTTPDTFTYTLTPGGDTATVSVTVTCDDGNPIANNDSATVTEDASATAINVLANDTDEEGDTFTITSVTQPAHGAVVITGGGTGLTYQPNANYCNSQAGGTPDTFTYTLTPGGSTATVSVTVTCVDDDPVAVDDSATVAEDAAATAIDVLANDTDVDGGSKSIASVTQPAHGTVVITGGGTGLTYQPNTDYCTSSTPDTFTYTLTPGGDTATVSVTVTCVEGNPVANDDAATVAEDAPATAVSVLANDTDEEGDAFTIASVTQPANGTVVITGGGTGLTYQPNANYCNSQAGGTPDTFTYTLTPGGDTATVSMTVTCAEDNPTAANDAATVLEDAVATPIDVLANDTDPDGGTKTITSVTQPANGTVVITNAGADLTYQPNANYCNSVSGTPDTFTYTLTPGGSTATVSMTVTCVEDNPTAANDSATVAEDSGPTAINVQANDTDPDGGTNTISSVTQPANGTVVITNAGANLTYQPNANYCNSVSGTPDTFTYTLTPGSSTATVSVTVTCVDDNPVAVNDAATVLEDAVATPIDVLANDTDADGGAKSVTSVTQPANGTVVITNAGADLTYQPNANYCNSVSGTPDTFTYTLTPGGSTATVSVTVTCVEDNPTAVNDAATVLEDAAATPINVLANDTDPDGGTNTISSATQPANGAVVITGGGTGLTYQPNANYCNSQVGGTPDTFTYTLTPGGSVATVSVTVTCVDDAPVAVNDAATVLEDAAATAIDVLANDTDIDGGPKSIASVTPASHGTVVITGGGTGLTYQPAANYCGSDSFTYTLTPGSSTATVSMTVTCVNDAPVLVDNTLEYTILGNTQLRVGDTTPGTGLFHMRDNQDVKEKTSPSDIDGPGPLDVVVISGPTTHGQINLNADGTFTYLPNPGFEGTDVINFQVRDHGTPEAFANGTITITVSEMVWYVHDVVDATNNPSASDTGQSTNAFEVLSDAVTAAKADPGDDDYIFVFAGNTATTPQVGGFKLDATGTKLHGEGIGLTVPEFGATPLIPAGAKPRIVLNTNATAGEDNGLSVDASATSLAGMQIRGFDIVGFDNAIDVTAAGANNADVMIRDNTVTGGAAEAVEVNANGTGTVTADVQNNVFNGGAGGFDAHTAAASQLRVNFSNNAGILAAGNAVSINGSGGGTTTITGFANNSVHSNTTGSGFVITSATFDATPGGGIDQVAGGTTVVGASGNGVGAAGVVLTNVQGNLFFTDLDIFADNGAGLRVSGTGSGMTFGVNPAVAIIEATGGPAVDVTSTALTLALTSLKSTNSPSTGVALNSVTGTFSAGSGSSISNITSAGGTAFQVGSSSATVTYDGTIATNQGTGVSLTNNTGTMSFTGTLTLNTGSSPAFAATGGGTVTATDTANVLTTTTGTALNVANTTIGAGGLKFRSISAGTAASGPANGIVLNSTGSLGGLTVTGTGSANSGGIIQKTTGDGISLTSTRNIALNRMRIASSGGSHIEASTVTNLTLNNVDTDTSTDHGIFGSNITNLTISGGTFHRGGAGAEPTCNKDGVNITNLLGTSSVTGATFTRSNTRQFYVTNNSNNGLDTLTVSGTTWGTHNGPCSGDHLSVAADTGGNLKLITNGSSGENNFSTGGIGIQAAANGSGNMQASITGVETSGNTAGVAIAGTANGNISFDVYNNRSALGTGFSGTGSVALIMTCTTSGTCQGRFDGNSINHTAGTATNAMQVVIEGNGTGKVQISNNTISGNCQRCLHAQSRAGSGSLSLHVTNNNLTATDAAGLQVMNFEVGASGGGTTNSICLNLANNTATPAGAMSAYRLLHRTGYTYQLQNLVQASTTNTADVQTWVTTTKSNAGTPVSVTVGSSPFTTSAGCATPTLPTP